MNDAMFRMIELAQQGFYCSQIMVQLGLKAQDKDNPDLIRAMNGLAGGLGFSGNICGALTGGTCLLGLYAGRGAREEKVDDRLFLMINRLVEWFEAEIGPNYGGTHCKDIIGEGAKQCTVVCGNIVASTYVKVTEILTANGIALDGTKNEGD